MQRFSRIPAARGAVALAVVLSMLVTAIGNVDFPEPSKRAVAQDEPVPSGDVIVILDDDAASAADVHAEATEDGVDPTVVFSTVVDGYAATVTQEQAADLAADPDVAAIYPDNPVYQASQTIPSGVKRIGADSNDVANINGVDQRVDADVALIDSGVDPNTGDLNVAGGTDCVGAGTYADQSGHGTHVAGTIAALDNNIGVVGVAPGARIWSVRALNGSGVGSDSTLICGLDWVYAHRATIDVVNMSVVGSGDDIACTRSGPPNDGSVPYSPMHEAVCKLYDAGIPIVAAAGNNKMNASNVTPATFGEVIAVSAFADYDGKPGGTGAKPLGCGQSTLDDRFYATSTIGSNFGPDVDIMAPGVCVQSTAMGGGTAMRTGTSMAAPHVAGAFARVWNGVPNKSDPNVYDDTDPDARWDTEGLPYDPDGTFEGVLHLSRYVTRC